MRVEIKRYTTGLALPFGPKEAAIFQERLIDPELTWIGYADDDLACIWGLVPQSVLSDTAYVWSWTGPIVKRYKRTFVKMSREIIAQMLLKYPILTGLCDGNFRWLQSLGAVSCGKLGEYTSFMIRA